MPLKTFCPRYVLPLLVALSGGLAIPIASAQSTRPASEAVPPAAATSEVPKKSKRLDKHAPPWEVIWNSRLWTDAPPAEDFVQATHPDPKSLEYAPLVGKEPERPKVRDAAGVTALQAELEGDVRANAARGKAINDISPSAETAKPAKTVTPGKAAKARRARQVAKASSAKASKAD